MEICIQMKTVWGTSLGNINAINRSLTLDLTPPRDVNLMINLSKICRLITYTYRNITGNIQGPYNNMSFSEVSKNNRSVFLCALHTQMNKIILPYANMRYIFAVMKYAQCCNTISI